jgi:hypothetical protein
VSKAHETIGQVFLDADARPVVRFALTTKEAIPMAAVEAQTWLTGRETLRVVPLRDGAAEPAGHHPCSNYVELFYLGFLGPSALVAARRLSAWLEISPEGFTVPTITLARQLGLGTGTGRNAPLIKTLVRLTGFGLAAVLDDAYAMRLAFPSLSPRQLRRLPPHLAEAHQRLGHAHPNLTTPPRLLPGRVAGESAADRARSGKPGLAAAHPLHQPQLQEVPS